MNLKELKQHFIATLSSIYPAEEIESFYFLLLAAILNLKRIDVALNPQKEIVKDDLQKLNISLEKLQQEIPIQYIIGSTEFFGLPFKVDKNVLIPRPETEELVDWIISTTLNTPTNNQQPTTINILDIGTGSGSIAISLAKNLSDSKVFALDISEKALTIAKENSELNKVSIEFIQQDILTLEDNVFASVTKQSAFNYEVTSSQTPRNNEVKLDIIVSNPPYVRELEKEEINNNVLEYEPHLALFVDDQNPLLFYNAIADFAKTNLKPNGQLFFEINQYLGKETVDLLKQKGFKNIELRKDIFGNDRMIRARV
ncbi:MAG: protein-(glutamine-N5) methyltransferase, release factor-specific [Flavobacteriaceae bacterium]|nr:MAG: protein-(glutamine-N5) methyltransferase, release factor-specific [Flavobacteriaceae bacterium]